MFGSIEINGHRCEYAFLVPNPSVKREDALYLVRSAFEMDMEKEDERRIELETLEGVINKEKYAVLGTIGGFTYCAELETPAGKARMKWIIGRIHDPNNN